MVDFNQQVINEFRESGGAPGGMFAGRHILLLHHVGAKTGTERINPLVYMPDGDSYVIVASKNGSPEHPAWFHNLKAHPDIKVEVGPDVIDVTAAEATGEERERIFGRLSEQLPEFLDYQAKTARVFPVIVLTPTG